MRILVATDQWFPDRRGGAARIATDTAQALAERGHAVDVIAPRQRDARPSVTVTGGLTVRRVIPRGRLPRTFADVVGARRAAAELTAAGRRFDVVIAHQTTVAMGVSLSCAELPLVLVYYESAGREMRFDRGRLPLGRRRVGAYLLTMPLAAYERRTMASAARVFVTSEYSRAAAVGDHPAVEDRIAIVSAGTDTAAFAPAADRRAAHRELGFRAADLPLLVTVRRLEPRMGLENLVRAVHELNRDGRAVRLAIAGSGSLGGSLRQLVSELGLNDCVRFMGSLDGRPLRTLLQAADLFILPTRAYEGFGVATVEALASGTPVIGTPVGATPELLRPLDPRLLARGTSVRDLVEAISAGLGPFSSPEFRERCRAYAVERFEWKRVICGWEEHLLHTVVARGDERVASRPIAVTS